MVKNKDATAPAIPTYFTVPFGATSERITKTKGIRIKAKTIRI
jgi:hypothetical protein